MILNRNIPFIFFMLLFISVFSVSAQYGVGDSVSNFTLNDVNGNAVSLYDYRGELIFLNFFATW